MKRFVEGADRGQSTLLPECLEDWIDEDNPVRAIDAFVDALDLASLGFDGVEPAATGSEVPYGRVFTRPRPISDILASRCFHTGAMPKWRFAALRARDAAYRSGSPALRRPSKKCSASSGRLNGVTSACVPSIVHLGSIRRTSAASALACSMFPSWAWVAARRMWTGEIRPPGSTLPQQGQRLCILPEHIVGERQECSRYGRIERVQPHMPLAGLDSPHWVS